MRPINFLILILSLLTFKVSSFHFPIRNTIRNIPTRKVNHISRFSTISNTMNLQRLNVPYDTTQEKSNVKKLNEFISWVDAVQSTGQRNDLRISPSTLSSYKGIGIEEAKELLYSASRITKSVVEVNKGISFIIK